MRGRSTLGRVYAERGQKAKNAVPDRLQIVVQRLPMIAEYTRTRGTWLGISLPSGQLISTQKLISLTKNVSTLIFPVKPAYTDFKNSDCRLTEKRNRKRFLLSEVTDFPENPIDLSRCTGSIPGVPVRFGVPIFHWSVSVSALGSSYRAAVSQNRAVGMQHRVLSVMTQVVDSIAIVQAIKIVFRRKDHVNEFRT